MEDHNNHKVVSDEPPIFSYERHFELADICIEFINSAPAIVPKIDYADWYEILCKDEIERITKLHDYSIDTLNQNSYPKTGPWTENDWFQPKSLGDEYLEYFHLINDSGSHIKIYSNFDKTRAFVIYVYE